MVKKIKFCKVFILSFAFQFLATLLIAQSAFTEKLSSERVASNKSIVWEQVSPGNAGFANLLRYHPTIPGKVALCPDMWNVYQSDNNGKQWYGITDPKSTFESTIPNGKGLETVQLPLHE